MSKCIFRCRALRAIDISEIAGTFARARDGPLLGGRPEWSEIIDCCLLRGADVRGPRADTMGARRGRRFAARYPTTGPALRTLASDNRAEKRKLIERRGSHAREGRLVLAEP